MDETLQPEGELGLDPIAAHAQVELEAESPESGIEELIADTPEPRSFPSSVMSGKGEKAIISRQVASKWVKTSVLRQDERIARHIPETRIYSRENVASMLNRYGKVVLKPTIGTGGHGLMMLSKGNGIYVLRHRRSVRRFRSFGGLAAAVDRIRRKRSYLVQRGISLATIRGRPIDYRVKVVRQKRQWVTRAMVGRLANPGLFVTNLCRGGTQLSSSEGIRRSLSVSAVRRKKNEMRFMTRISTQLLERHFPGIGQLGFDYGFDHEGKLWIFEVNTKPH